MSLETPDPQPAGPPICGPPLPWECSIFDAVKKDPSDVEPPDAINEGSAILPPFVATAGVDASIRAEEASESGLFGAMPVEVPLVCVLALVLLANALRRRLRRRRSGAATSA